jgi:hypothetical protein
MMSNSKLKKTSDLADQVIEKLSKAAGVGVGMQASNRRPVNGLTGWSQDPTTGALHHGMHGVISTTKGPNGIEVKHGGKTIGQFKDFGSAGAGIHSHISSLGVGDTGMAPPSAMDKKDEEEIEKSGYGPKGKSQYNPTDNIKRKANNTGDAIGAGPNTNVKSYSTKPGQLSSKAQAALDASKTKQKSGPVKQWSPEEIAAENEKRNMKKSWGQHLPFPSGEAQYGHPPQRADEIMANQLANMLHNRAILGATPPRQPRDSDIIGDVDAPTMEQVQKAQNIEWSSKMNDFFAEATKPISSRFNSEEEELAYWASIKIEDRE